MAKDQQGLLLTGAPESAAAHDRAIADYYGLTGDPVGILYFSSKASPNRLPRNNGLHSFLPARGFLARIRRSSTC